jgi:hypothetical protein
MRTCTEASMRTCDWEQYLIPRLAHMCGGAQTFWKDYDTAASEEYRKQGIAKARRRDGCACVYRMPLSVYQRLNGNSVTRARQGSPVAFTLLQIACVFALANTQNRAGASGVGAAFKSMMPPRHLQAAEFQPQPHAKWAHAGRRQECRCVLARVQGARVPSGWAEKASDGDGRQIDRLHNLGQAQNYNINVDHGTPEPLHSL